MLRRRAQSAIFVNVDPVINVAAQISKLFSGMPLLSGHDCQSPECFPQFHVIFIWLPLMIMVGSVIELVHSGQVLKSWRRWDLFTSHFFSAHPCAVSPAKLAVSDVVPVLAAEPELGGIKLVSAGSMLKSLKLVLTSRSSASISSSTSLCKQKI